MTKHHRPGVGRAYDVAVFEGELDGELRLALALVLRTAADCQGGDGGACRWLTNGNGRVWLNTLIETHAGAQLIEQRIAAWADRAATFRAE